MRSKNFTIFNRAVIVAVCFLIIQQLIVASSTLWITQLIAGVQKGSFSFLLLGLFLSSLFLPYFPGAAALVQIARAKAKAQVGFINSFAEVHAGNILEWANTSRLTKKTSTLSGEAPRTIDSYLDYIYHLASSGLNVLLNLLVVAIIIEPMFLLSYGIGIGIAFLILRWQKKRKKRLALKSQQSRIQWIGMLLKAWDHVLLNNRYNFQIWNTKKDKRAQRYQGSALKLAGFSQAVSVCMAFTLLIPSFVLVCLLAYLRREDLVFLAMLVVILPRLFQVLAYSYEMLFLLSDFPQEQSRLGTVLKLIEPSAATIENEHQLEKRIEWDRISAIWKIDEGLKTKPAPSLLNGLPQQGRITLKGENGSGKTSLLLLLKQKYGEQAFYLPAKHELFFLTAKDKLSTGQKARKILEELIYKVEAPIILLDEWDANLDAENAHSLSGLIEKLSVKRCVVESIHVKQ